MFEEIFRTGINAKLDKLAKSNAKEQFELWIENDAKLREQDDDPNYADFCSRQAAKVKIKTQAYFVQMLKEHYGIGKK